MNRGDIYWVELNPTVGSEMSKLRPCVLVGATSVNQARRTVVVIPLSTSATARPPITISLFCHDKQVTAVCDQIRTVDKSRFRNQMGSLTETDINQLDDALRQVLCL